MDIIQNQFFRYGIKSGYKYNTEHQPNTDIMFFILILKSNQHQGELPIINNILLLTLSGIFYA